MPAQPELDTRPHQLLEVLRRDDGRKSADRVPTGGVSAGKGRRCLKSRPVLWREGCARIWQLLNGDRIGGGVVRGPRRVGDRFRRLVGAGFHVGGHAVFIDVLRQHAIGVVIDARRQILILRDPGKGPADVAECVQQIVIGGRPVVRSRAQQVARIERLGRPGIRHVPDVVGNDLDRPQLGIDRRKVLVGPARRQVDVLLDILVFGQVLTTGLAVGQ